MDIVACSFDDWLGLFFLFFLCLSLAEVHHLKSVADFAQ